MRKERRTSENDDTKKVAFVISPIGDPDSTERKRANQILNHIIRPIASELGYEAIRADKISKPGIITSQVINHIINDQLVIADLTGHNPNVFYELAVRHTIKKPVIQIIEKGEKIPFDVSTTRTIQVDHKDLDSVDEAKKELMRHMRAVEKDASLVESPISVAVDLHLLKQSDDPTRKALAELRTHLEGISMTVGDIRNRIALQEMRKARLFPSHTGKSQMLFDFLLPTRSERDEFLEYFEEIYENLKKQKREGKSTKRSRKKATKRE